MTADLAEHTLLARLVEALLTPIPPRPRAKKLQPRMLQGLLCGDALRRAAPEQFAHEVLGLVRKVTQFWVGEDVQVPAQYIGKYLLSRLTREGQLPCEAHVHDDAQGPQITR